MNKRFLFFIVFIFLSTALFPQENPSGGPVPAEPLSSEKVAINSEQDKNNNDKSKKINLDMQVVYGPQFNQMFSTLNISQESDTFVLLLSSFFNKAGDFGYNRIDFINSGFYENNIGLTGNWNWDKVKLIVDMGTDNDSRGMFDNQVYSKEEKGNFKLNAKAIYKYNPRTEMYLSVGGAQYKHSLVGIDPVDHNKSRLFQGNVNTGMELVWSAANRLKFNAGLLYYDYSPKDIPQDNHIKIDFFNIFTITRNLGISIGAGFVRNEDDREVKFPFPLNGGVYFKGYNKFSMSLNYAYDILPFRPEEFYLEQKYINPNYYLPPSVVQKGTAKADYKFNSLLSLTGSFQAEKNKNFYNYIPVNGNVLSANTLDAMIYSSGLDLIISLIKMNLEFALGCEYFYYDADMNITYQPDYTTLGSIRYNNKKWKLEWNNKLRSKVHTNPDPDINEEIPEAIIGSLAIQRIVLDGSYFNIRIDNLYNNRYELRKDYPEPGISMLAGLRILI